VKRPGIFFAVLACAFLAGCAGPYRAPVVERTVARPSAAKPAAAPEEQRPESYTVKRGDTLYSIALDNGLDYRDLAAWNNISDPAAIKVGLVLRMRPPGPAVALRPEAGPPVQPEARVQVQPVTVPGSVEARPLGADPRAAVEPRAGAEPPRVAGDLKTGPKAMKLPYSEENLAMLLRQSPPKPESTPESLPSQPNAEDGQDTVAWIWPATGRVLAGFSEATNKGVDILGKIGDPVFASASGRVVYSGTGLRGYGKLVIIKHNQTYLSAYAHNSNLLVKEGQNVARGQKIAEIGDTDSTQAKLHFEIRRLGKPVDPLKFLPDRPS
jgi:lipoprotein NlpD